MQQVRVTGKNQQQQQVSLVSTVFLNSISGQVTGHVTNLNDMICGTAAVFCVIFKTHNHNFSEAALFSWMQPFIL